MNALKTLLAATLIMATALSGGGCRERKDMVYAYRPADVLTTAPANAHYGQSAPTVVYYSQPAPVVRYYTTPYPVYISRYRSDYGGPAVRGYYDDGNWGFRIGTDGRRHHGHYDPHRRSGHRTHPSHRTRR